MTDQQHPIAPPQELVPQWATNWNSENCCDLRTYIANCAAQWGADTELEKCCEWFILNNCGHIAKKLIAARRPKPPSLKEQALAAQQRMYGGSTHADWQLIRRALETLPND